MNEILNYRMKINLVTQTDIITFVNIAAHFDKNAKLYIMNSDKNMCINARSLLGCLAAQEFDNMWLYSDNDKIHTAFRGFEINE